MFGRLHRLSLYSALPSSFQSPVCSPSMSTRLTEITGRMGRSSLREVSPGMVTVYSPRVMGQPAASRTAAETDSSSLPASFSSAYSMPYESRSLIVASVSMSPPPYAVIRLGGF